MSAPKPFAVRTKNLTFGWKPDSIVLDIPELVVEVGERVFLYGPSGCGKSTLLGLIAGVLKPSQGELFVLDQPLHQMSQSACDRFRADHVGVIFQTFNLLPFLPVVDNIRLGNEFSARRSGQALMTERSDESVGRLIGRLGLSADILNRSVKELSVGQQQRVAVARALIGGPELVIADEPTSALDSDTRDRFIDLLVSECDAAGSTLIFVSHDMSLSAHFNRKLDLTQINRSYAEQNARAACP